MAPTQKPAELDRLLEAYLADREIPVEPVPAGKVRPRWEDKTPPLPSEPDLLARALRRLLGNA